MHSLAGVNTIFLIKPPVCDEPAVSHRLCLSCRSFSVAGWGLTASLPAQVVSTTRSGGFISVVLERSLRGISENHYSFVGGPQALNIITASGSSASMR
jgi:hypothetical protein